MASADASKSLPQRVQESLDAAGSTAEGMVPALGAAVALQCVGCGLHLVTETGGTGPSDSTLTRLDDGHLKMPPATSDGASLEFRVAPASKRHVLSFQIVQIDETVSIAAVVEAWDAPRSAVAGPFSVELPIASLAVPGGLNALALLAPLWNPASATAFESKVQSSVLQPALEAAGEGGKSAAAASSSSSSATASSSSAEPLWSSSQVPVPTGKRSSPSVPGLADAEALPPPRRGAGSRHPDLMPAFGGMMGGGMGMGGGGLGIGGGGMLVGPDDPGFRDRMGGGVGGMGGGGMGGGGMGGGGMGGGGMGGFVPPGARFDPVGPPGMGGRGRGRGRGRGQGSGMHPDLLQPPPGGDFM